MTGSGSTTALGAIGAPTGAGAGTVSKGRLAPTTLAIGAPVAGVATTRGAGAGPTGTPGPPGPTGTPGEAGPDGIENGTAAGGAATAGADGCGPGPTATAGRSTDGAGRTIGFAVTESMTRRSSPASSTRKSQW